MRVTNPSANCFMKVEFKYEILFTEYAELCEKVKVKWYSYPMTKRTRTIPALPIKHELNPNVVCRKFEH